MSLDTEYYPCTKGRYTGYVLTSSETRRPLSLIGSVSATVSATSVVDDHRKTIPNCDAHARCMRPDPDVCEQHIDELLPQV